MTIGIQDSLKSLGKIKIHGEEVAIIDRDSDNHYSLLSSSMTSLTLLVMLVALCLPTMLS